jgi:hypothetical protein
MIHLGPVQAREVLDQLESEIVDPDRALREADAGQRDDVIARVPSSPEPPD